MKTFPFCPFLAAIFAASFNTTALSAPMMSSDFPHREPTMADFYGPTMADFMGKGKDWLSYPTLDANGNFNFENDFTAPRGGQSNNSLTTTSQLFSLLNFAPRLSLLTHITYGVVDPGAPGENIWFKGEGLFMEEAYLQYRNDLLTVQIGKFDSDFSVAPSLAPGTRPRRNLPRRPRAATRAA